MHDKRKKVIDLLEDIKSVLQGVSGEVMVVLTCEGWDKVLQVKSLLRSILSDAEGLVVHRCKICEREVSIPFKRVHDTMYSPVCCDWPMDKVYLQTEEPTSSPEAECRTCKKLRKAIEKAGEILHNVGKVRPDKAEQDIEQAWDILDTARNIKPICSKPTPSLEQEEEIDNLTNKVKELERIIVDAKKSVKIVQEQSEALEEERNLYQEKLHDQVNTATLKELDVFLTHTKKIGKLKTEISVLKKKEGD